MDNKLDGFLRPINSPAQRNSLLASQTGQSYDNAMVKSYNSALTEHGDLGNGAVTNKKVKNLSFSVLNGGTAILGGLNNGDGLLVVNNAGGTQVVRLDSTGIVISAGTITGVTVENIDSGTLSNAFIGTSIFTAGSVTNSLISGGTATNQIINSATLGTPAITGGTINNPRIAGTTIFDTASGSVALANNGQFAIQTFSGSAVLTARLGGTTFYFVCAGTI